jgi:hypothetical protein
LLLDLKVNDKLSTISSQRIFHLDNVNLVTSFINTSASETEALAEEISVFLVLERERGHLVEADSHEVLAAPTLLLKIRDSG